MSERNVELEILRYNPDTDEKPSFQIFRVPCQEDWVVLDAINYVKDNLQSELVSSLYKQEEISSLLSESEHIGQRRKEAAEMLRVML